MATNPDFKDLFSALSDAGADFLVVGAHAVMFYTVPRYTKDLDLWIRTSRANAERVYAALAVFGAPIADLSVEDLAAPGTTFQMGVEPNRIDVLTSLDGLRFDEAWARRTASTYGGIPIAILGFEDLVRNKRAVDRPQDRLDVDNLERARSQEPR